ncbi:hypothetical protein AB205_0141740, partial [Aquarana catesbeiana]
FSIMAVSFEEFSVPPGSELALPPLFGGNILESELETEVEFVDGGLAGENLQDEEEEQTQQRIRELNRRKFLALNRRCKEIEQSGRTSSCTNPSNFGVIVCRKVRWKSAESLSDRPSDQSGRRVRSCVHGITLPKSPLHSRVIVGRTEEREDGQCGVSGKIFQHLGKSLWDRVRRDLKEKEKAARSGAPATA